MKHGLKKRILSLVLCISMVLPMAAVPMPVYSVENEESIAPLSNPFTPETIITLPDGTITKSQSYRIPSIVTLADGTVVAAADIRWNTTYDGGGLDTLVARSTDDGQTWSYTVANYLGDNGNEYNYSSTTFIDPSLLVGADGQTVYMLTDLYAYGVALNGPWKTGTDPYFSYPIADTGFDANGNLKLSSNNRSSFGYYLKDGKIYANGATQPEAGYSVDGYFNITYTENNIEKTSNLFFEDSPFQVAKTQFLYLTKSTDGGATWSEPTLLNLRKTPIGVYNDEDALLVSPGNAITTSDGVMVYPVYSYAHTPTSSSASASEQHLGLIYSTDGVNWERTANFTGLDFSSEGSVIELENGNLRVFFRNTTGHLCYVDYNLSAKAWGKYVDTEVPVNSNTQLSAITYSETVNGDQVVLISCPTGPNAAGSGDSNGAYRTNGKIHVFTVDSYGTMTLKNTVNLFDNLATSDLQGSDYTEALGFFAYSSLTERSDGSIVILYENNQFGWGAGDNKYYTITAKTYDWFELLYGNVSEELKVAYEKLMDTDLIADFEAEYETLSASDFAELQKSVMWDDIAVHKCLLVYDHFYSTVSEAEFNAVKNQYPNEFAYIQADPELKYFNDLVLEDVRYLDQHPEKRYMQFGEVTYVELPSYTNVAPLVDPTAAPVQRNVSTYGLRSTTVAVEEDDAANGILLDKKVTPNADGSGYTVRLEAYTTGATVTTVTEKEMPADIILVLDLSNSMTMYSMDVMGYRPITSSTAKQAYDKYIDGEQLFVQIGEDYHTVNISGTNPSTTDAVQYTGNRTPLDIYNYTRDNTLYVEYEEGKYVPIKCSRTGNSKYTIQYTHPVTGETVRIIQNQNGSATIDSRVFYTSPSSTVYENYTFSYKDANGQTVTKTYNATASIVGNDPAYYEAYKTGSVQRATALKSAVTAFAAQVAEKAKGQDELQGTDDDVAHSIAIVGFNNPSHNSNGIYIGSTVHKAGTAAEAVYGTALQDMSTKTGVDNITASINKLTNEQGTYTYSGTEMANGILAAQPDSRYVNEKGETIRGKVVVIFTDGDPNGTDPYNAPILDTYEMKNTHKATVYTVGILSNGNATISPDGSIDNGAINRFMHYMSSNFQYAQSMTNPGDLTNTNHATAGSYYLLASSADDLNNIFGSISSSATSGGSITDLSTETQIRDIISPYFQLPENADLSDIKLYSADYMGGDTWGDAVDLPGAIPTISADRKVIGVTGFDYKENWVGTATDAAGKVTYHGKKLIIEFPIEVDPDFLGGSNVVTNGDTSGIYESATATTPIEKFEVPDVDVELREISTVVQDKHIYLSNTVDLTSLLNLYVKRDDQNTDLRVTVDGVNNAYVNLEYTITLDDETVAVYTIPFGSEWDDGSWDIPDDKVALLRDYLATKDTPFTVTCVMTDAANSSNQSQASDSANVYVYKPTVTFQDATKIPNSESVDYAKDNFVSVVWLHGTTEATPSTVEGTAPTLTYTYSTPSGCIDSNGLVITYNEFYVNVTKVLSTGNKGDIDITNYVTFAHKDCPCGFVASNGEFMIHLTQVYTSLVIQKAGWEAIDPNQSFIFNVVEVDANGNPIDNTTVTVTVHENGSVTIEGLLVNRSYKVTEDTNWSWRYVFSGWEFKSGGSVVSSGDKNGAIVTLGSEGNIITFENERSVIWWLDGDSWCNNIFKKKEGA